MDEERSWWTRYGDVVVILGVAVVIVMAPVLAKISPLGALVIMTPVAGLLVFGAWVFIGGDEDRDDKNRPGTAKALEEGEEQ